MVAKRLRMRFSKRLLSIPGQKKTDLAAEPVAERRFPMSVVAKTLDGSRSNLHERPTYGYRRIAALVKRQRLVEGLPVVNLKRVHRIMSNHQLLLSRHMP